MISPDPLKHCDVYKKQGCTHVDGFLCDVRTCDILHDFRKANEFAVPEKQKTFFEKLKETFSKKSTSIAT